MSELVGREDLAPSEASIWGDDVSVTASETVIQEVSRTGAGNGLPGKGRESGPLRITGATRLVFPYSYSE